MQNEGALQASARRFALTVGHAMELALTCRHAQWSLEGGEDGRSAAAAVRFTGVGWHVAGVNHRSALDLVKDREGAMLFVQQASEDEQFAPEDEPSGDGAV